MTDKKYVHILYDGKLVGIKYGDVKEIRDSLPEIKKFVEEKN